MKEVKIYHYDGKTSPWILEDHIEQVEKNRGMKHLHTIILSEEHNIQAICYFVYA